MELILLLLSFLTAAATRYYLSKILNEKIAEKFSYASISINILGCFLLGVFMVYASKSGMNISPSIELNNILIAVFIAFTTFSYKTVQFLKNKMLIKASTNIFYNLFLGLVFFTIGNLIGR